jgi:hypothetical protein
MFPSQQIQFSLGYFIVIPAKAGIQGGKGASGEKRSGATEAAAPV